MFVFFLLLSLPSSVLQWHHEGDNFFSEYDRSNWSGDVKEGNYAGIWSEIEFNIVSSVYRANDLHSWNSYSSTLSTATRLLTGESSWNNKCIKTCKEKVKEHKGFPGEPPESTWTPASIRHVASYSCTHAFLHCSTDGIRVFLFLLWFLTFYSVKVIHWG